MEKNCNRKKTFYFKDVLPPHVVQNANNEFLDMNEAVSNQLIITRNCEEKLKEKQQKLIVEISQILEENKDHEIGVLDESFVNVLLQKVKTEEKSLRNNLIGQQETVEMLKKAVLNNEIDDSYLELEREKRNHLTSCLSNIVEQREVVFSVLEILQRSNVANSNNDFSVLTKLKKEYEDLDKLRHSEDQKLKKFTEWQHKPGLMFKKRIAQANQEMQ